MVCSEVVYVRPSFHSDEFAIHVHPTTQRYDNICSMMFWKGCSHCHSYERCADSHFLQKGESRDFILKYVSGNGLYKMSTLHQVWEVVVDIIYTVVIILHHLLKSPRPPHHPSPTHRNIGILLLHPSGQRPSTVIFYMFCQFWQTAYFVVKATISRTMYLLPRMCKNNVSVASDVLEENGVHILLSRIACLQASVNLKTT